MRFVVVACLACHRVQAVESRFERSRCVACHRPIVLREVRVFHRCDEAAEARLCVMRVGARVHGMDESELARVLASLQPPVSTTVEHVLDALAGAGEFTVCEFANAFRRAGLAGEPAPVLERLRTQNRVFEPREGRFRVV